MKTQHAEKRRVPYTNEQMFDIVADIEKYPDFLPWCLGSRIRESEKNILLADMLIGYKLFREKFTSKVTLSFPSKIEAVYSDGPFKYLINRWEFIEEDDGACTIDFFVDFEFRSKLMQKLIGVLFNDAVKIMVKSFEDRAKNIYG